MSECKWPPLLTGWNVSNPLPKNNCPVCGSVLKEVWSTIGGFPGHEHVHPSSTAGYQCHKCNRYFPLGEFMALKAKEAWEKAHPGFVKKCWKDLCNTFGKPYPYLIVIAFMLLGRHFRVGFVAGAIFILTILLLYWLSVALKKKLKPPVGSDPPASSKPH